MLSAATQNYLTAIYRVGRSGELVSTTSIAECLQVAAPSVTGMIRHLAEQGLVEHVPYRGSRLTEAGTVVALRVIRRHHVLETYLMQVLGYSRERGHVEAGRLEQVTSDELIDRMTKAIGEPPADLNGALIPGLGPVP